MSLKLSKNNLELNYLIEDLIRIGNKIIIGNDLRQNDQLWLEYSNNYAKLQKHITTNKIQISKLQYQQFNKLQVVISKLLIKLYKQKTESAKELKQIRLTENYGKVIRKKTKQSVHV